MQNQKDFNQNEYDEKLPQADSLNTQNDDGEKSKNSLRLFIIFIVVFAVTFAGIMIGLKLYENSINDPPETTAAPVTQAQEKVKNPINFAELTQQNGDVYAWLTVGNTNVDHPIVQHPQDDSFYLRHDGLTKKWEASGAIYTELVNSKDFSDPITVIYGHNGYGSTMFTTLHRFEKEEFFNENEYFYIYTPSRKLTYQIISAFKYDDRHIMNSFNFVNPADLKAFQSDILSTDNSTLKNTRTQLDTTVNENSKIVVLSTCITNQKSNRFLVCGVLVKDEQTY